MSIIVNWFDVYVQKDHPDEGCDPDSGMSRGDKGPGWVFASLKKLDAGLEGICLPPLSEWEESDSEEGQFHYSKSEDNKGYDMTDEEYRADPSRGLFCVDYSISLSIAVTHALTAKDVREMMA